MKQLGDVILIAICASVIITSVSYIDKHYSTSNVEQKAK